jgi:hypothetical protein
MNREAGSSGMKMGTEESPDSTGVKEAFTILG